MRHYRTASSAIALSLCLLHPTPGQAQPPFGATVTPLLESGDVDHKKNFVIIGDGFTAADQATYNTLVDDVIFNSKGGDALFTEGPLWEDQNAFNVYRINVNSVDSGITQLRGPISETLTPDSAPNGSKRSFTFSALANIPITTDTAITDPSGITIRERPGEDISRNPAQLANDVNTVTGTVDRNTGIITLNYDASIPAPPAGNFTVSYGAVTLQRDTVLDIGFGPSLWCYFRNGAHTEDHLNQILTALLVRWDYVTIVVNEPGLGGCSGGGVRQVVTSSQPWTTYAHESGHMVGGLCDEYVVYSRDYPNPEPGCPNITINDGKDCRSLKWAEFLDPNTPCPNTPGGTGHPADTVGHFLGGDYYPTKVWRVTDNNRMRGNINAFGPVNYTHIKEVLDDPFHEHDFSESYVGDFDGDGKSDLVLHNANTLELYISDGTHLAPKWIRALPLGDWHFMEHDQFLVGDFNGDGRDDLFTYNMTDATEPRFGLLQADASKPGFTLIAHYSGSLPGWGIMKPNDQFFVADFDGDGKDDLYIANTSLTDWPIGYLGMVRSTGTELAPVMLYVNSLPGWDKMAPGDQFFVANVDGTGGKDLYIVNNTSWCTGYLLSLLSTGTGLTVGVRYDQSVPGWGNLLPGDRYQVADFEGKGREGLYAFNASDWPVPYLGVMRSLGTGAVDVPLLHQGYVSGWGSLQLNDRFMTANIDGQGGTDLYGFNVYDHPGKSIGRLISSSSGFAGSRQTGSVGKWTLGHYDVFHVANYNGTAAGGRLDDLFVHADAVGNEFFGLLSNNGSSLDGPVLYKMWIHHVPYNSNGYW